MLDILPPVRNGILWVIWMNASQQSKQELSCLSKQKHHTPSAHNHLVKSCHFAHRKLRLRSKQLSNHPNQKTVKCLLPKTSNWHLHGLFQNVKFCWALSAPWSLHLPVLQLELTLKPPTSVSLELLATVVHRSGHALCSSHVQWLVGHLFCLSVWSQG